MNKRYGLKEVANVIFFDIQTKKPVIFFDTLKVSTIENESESAEARGGQGNNKLMSWDFGRTATLTLQDALLSDTSLAMLSGNAVKSSNITAVGREVFTVPAGLKVVLQNAPLGASTTTAFKIESGIMTTEITTFTIGTSTANKEITFTGVQANDQVVVFYEYTVTDTNARQITFAGNAFPATYRVVGDTIVRGEDGVDRKMQFIIPKAKLQSNFSLTMDAENVSTFDFNLEVLTEAGTNKLYDIIRLG
jgi:hypothetical protein